MARPPNFLVVGYFGYGLVGDDAVLEVALNDLRTGYPGCDITVTSVDPEATHAELGVTAVKIDSFDAIGRALRACDVVILAAAGGLNEHMPLSAFHSIDEPLPYNRLCMEVPLLAHRYGVPCVIFAAGVGELHSDLAKRMVRNCFDAASARAVRDSSALRLLAQTGANMDGVVVTCDPAWALTRGQTPMFDVSSLGLAPDRPILALTLRHWDLAPLRLSQEPQPWEDAVAAAVNAFCEETGAQALFIPNQVSVGYLFADDRAFAERFRTKLGKCTTALWPLPVTPQNVLAGLSLCDVSLAMRHHGAILAAVAGVPGVAIAYTEKVRGAWADAGLDDRIVDLDSISENHLADTLLAVWHERQSERVRLASVVANRQTLHRQTVVMLETVIASSSCVREAGALADAYLSVREVSGSVLPSAARDELVSLLSHLSNTGGDPSFVKAKFARLAELQPREPLYFMMLGFYEVQFPEAPDRGIDALKQAEALGYAPEWCLYWQSRIRLGQEDTLAARKCLEEALVVNPDFELARALLVDL